MTEPSEDAGVIGALIERFEKLRLPRVLEMKERVDKGEKLTDIDMEFLGEVFEDAKHMKKYIDRNPKFQDAAAQAMSLYSEITAKALENEKN